MMSNGDLLNDEPRIPYDNPENGFNLPNWNDGTIAETSRQAYATLCASGALSDQNLHTYAWVVWACAPGRTFRLDGETYEYDGWITPRNARDFYNQHWGEVTGNAASRIHHLWRDGLLERNEDEHGHPIKRTDPGTGCQGMMYRPSGRCAPIENVPRKAAPILNELVESARQLMEQGQDAHTYDQFWADMAELFYSAELLQRYPIPGVPTEV